LGLAQLSKVTVISPRSDYEEVARALAQFEDFHPVGGREANFDPKVQELTVKAVRLYAQADQAVKDLGIPLMPGTIDIVFRGVKIPRSEFSASTWDELLNRAEADLNPILEEVRVQRAQLQKVQKDGSDAMLLRAALEAVAGFSADLSDLPALQRFRAVLVVVRNPVVPEFRNSLPGLILLSQQLNQSQSLALVIGDRTDGGRIEKAMKALDLKPLSIPSGLPQNPAEAYRKLTQDWEAAEEERVKTEANLLQLKVQHSTTLLAVRELAEVARETLDEVRASGPMSRLAMISGYVPSRREGEFENRFGKWMVSSEVVEPHGGHGAEEIPTLLENPAGLRSFQQLTGQQGTPGHDEVDSTPLTSFVFPIFFGLMFGDLGHAMIITLVAFLVRQRGTGSMRQWGNIFLACGISSMVFGVIFGEFFGFSLYKFVPIPTLLEIVQRPIGGNASIITANIEIVMVFAILIGIAHLTTGLSLDVFEAAKAKERLELVAAKIPTLTMYLSGVGYGIAFIGAGYSFDVLKTSGLAPLFTYAGLRIPNNELGTISLAVLLASMFVLFAGRGIAAMTGRIHGRSAGELFAEGGLEVFERISQFLSNTISYVRLAIMLLVHAVLLLIINQFFPVTNLVNIAPWVILNALILSFEAFVVYVQDLRLHIYEFFTKFYRGTGKPFRKLVPDRTRTRIKWT
jgi:V/A-type H+-transporting ATPase subunit I